MYKLSIIIPVYNRPKLLKETLNSTKNLKEDIEIIVIDDGSEKNNANIQKKLANKNSAKYFYQENKGLSEARNLGIRKSQGQFLFFLDSDDLLHNDFVYFLNKSYKTWSKHNVSRYNSIDFSNGLKAINKTKHTFFNKNHTVQVSSFLIRKTFLLENHLFFMGRLYEDNLWNFYLKKAIKNKMHFFNIYSIWYRTSMDNNKLTAKKIIIFKDIKHYLDPAIYKKDKNFALLSLTILSNHVIKKMENSKYLLDNLLLDSIKEFTNYISENIIIKKKGDKKKLSKLLNFLLKEKNV